MKYFLENSVSKEALRQKVKAGYTFPSPDGLKCHNLPTNKKWRKILSCLADILLSLGMKEEMSLYLARAVLQLRVRQTSTLAGNEVATSLRVSSLRANIGLKPVVILLLTS